MILIQAVKVVFQDKGGYWNVCYIKRCFSCGLGLTKERLHTGISDKLLIGEIRIKSNERFQHRITLLTVVFFLKALCRGFKASSN